MPEPEAVTDGMEETLHAVAAAGNYNAWLFARARPFLGDRVLDAGAGLGTFVDSAAAVAERVVAAEPDPHFAAHLRRRFAGFDNVEVVEEDAAAAGGGEFDSVICFNVLEHIADDEAALRRLRERLVPGGRLLLLVPAHAALYGPTDTAVGHERRYGKRGLGELLVRAGYELEELRLVNPLGALGWLISGKLLRRSRLPGGPLRAYDRLVPLLRALDRVEWPVGLSVWAVARRP